MPLRPAAGPLVLLTLAAARETLTAIVVGLCQTPHASAPGRDWPEFSPRSRIMAGNLVNQGSMLECTMGTAPASLTVVPTTVTADTPAAANIMDYEPMVNIPTFGMCNSPANPLVAAATSAAMGVLTPMPCVPLTTPWTPGVATVMVRGMPALDSASTCMCGYGGEIAATTPDVMVEVGG